MQLSHNIELHPSADLFDKNGTLLEHRDLPILGRQSLNTIDITVKNKDGKVDKVFTFPFRSFTRNFNALLCRTARNDYTAASVLRHDTGVNISGSSAAGEIPVNGGYGIETKGIRLGTGVNPVNINDYSLTWISHGSTVGKLLHNAVDFEDVVSFNGGYKFVVKRIFNNSSGNTINIREVGIISTFGSYYFILTRDRVNSQGQDINIDLLNGQTMEVKYNFFSNGTDGIMKNFISLLYARMASTTKPGINYLGNACNINESQSYQPFASHGLGDNFGINVGSGITPVTVDDYNLAARMEHGSSVGQLIYNATSLIPYTVGLTDCSWGLSRIFTNDSPETQVVREAGIMSRNYSSGTTLSNYSILLARVLTGDLSLDPGQTVQLNFIFKTSV